jgi:hypothetical protein
MAKAKRFYLSAEQINPLAEGHGACLASDMITVHGSKVGYMYRESPDNDLDSGWRFMAGHESQEYIDNADNIAVYDVNTIANYDPDIIPFLTAPLASAFARNQESGDFEEVEFEPIE